MECLGITDSGNYAIHLCSIFESMGIILEVVAVPCKIASGGCGYCIKFPEELMNLVLEKARKYKINIREVYRIEKEDFRVNYIRLYPQLL